MKGIRSLAASALCLFAIVTHAGALADPSELCTAADDDSLRTHPKVSSRLSSLCDSFAAATLESDPTLAVTLGLPWKDQSGLPDHSPSGLERLAAKQDRVLAEALRIDPATLRINERAILASMREQLESIVQTRICRRELWGVDHMDGWPSAFVHVAAYQPVGTAAARRAALERLGYIERYAEVEIANLRAGLKLGYSAPKPVVARLIRQVESLAAKSGVHSPFFSPGTRDGDPKFKMSLARLIDDRVNRALLRYAGFLKMEYLPKARESLGLAALPNGEACYDSLIHRHTTLRRSGREIHAIGGEVVAARTAEVVEIGQKEYGLAELEKILAPAASDPARRFASPEELFAYAECLMPLAQESAAKLVTRLPLQAVVVERMRPFEEAAGQSSYYEPNPDLMWRAVFRARLGNWRSEGKGRIDVLVAHEAYPGHHLQIALAVNTPTFLSRS